MANNIKKVKPSGVYKSSIYVPLYPEKYIGDVHNIISRSSWEFRFCRYCDQNEKIVKWSSEAVQVPYYNPLDKKDHIYNVDFYAKIQNVDDSFTEWIIEVKPESQHQKPAQLVGNVTEQKLISYNRKMQIWITNQAKFKAAKEWADKRGWRFGIIDENFLFRGK